VSTYSKTHKGLPLLLFPDQQAWREWLEKNWSTQPKGVWLVLSKKGGSVTAPTYPQAREEALCYGWIDGTANRYDDHSYLVRMTPRRSRSNWSELNKILVVELIENGKMQPSGMAEIVRAQKDGRWDRA
jgi:uncharacterized protein YdeI (YjbR/CyaY-like superfamily)